MADIVAHVHLAKLAVVNPLQTVWWWMPLLSSLQDEALQISLTGVR